jgi:hypothetical protein
MALTTRRRLLPSSQLDGLHFRFAQIVDLIFKNHDQYLFTRVGHTFDQAGR